MTKESKHSQLMGASFLVCKYYFDDNQITDSGFKTLVANAEKLTNLKSLHISLNKLSNAGVKALT